MKIQFDNNLPTELLMIARMMRIVRIFTKLVSSS
jgi:hypothetical protein